MVQLTSTNIIRRRLIKQLVKLSRKDNKRLWRRIAEELARPRRRRRAVNLSRINRYAEEGDVVVVPGKVLGSGSLNKKLTVIAESYSLSAYEKIKSSGGTPLRLRDIVEDDNLRKEVVKGKTIIIG